MRAMAPNHVAASVTCWWLLLCGPHYVAAAPTSDAQQDINGTLMVIVRSETRVAYLKANQLFGGNWTQIELRNGPVSAVAYTGTACVLV